MQYCLLSYYMYIPCTSSVFLELETCIHYIYISNSHLNTHINTNELSMSIPLSILFIIVVLLYLLSGDIESNPGHTHYQSDCSIESPQNYSDTTLSSKGISFGHTLL